MLLPEKVFRLTKKYLSDRRFRYLTRNFPKLPFHVAIFLSRLFLITKGGVGGKMLNEVGFMQWESSWIKPCNGRKMYDKSAVLITSQGNSRPSFTKNMFVILLMNASKRLILLLLHLSLCIWKILKSKFGLKWSKVSLLQPFFSISWCYL